MKTAEDFRMAFGEPDEGFDRALCQALEQLNKPKEAPHMNKKFRFILVFAILAFACASAAVAEEVLGLSRLFGAWLQPQADALYHDTNQLLFDFPGFTVHMDGYVAHPDMMMVNFTIRPKDPDTMICMIGQPDDPVWIARDDVLDFPDGDKTPLGEWAAANGYAKITRVWLTPDDGTLPGTTGGWDTEQGEYRVKFTFTTQSSRQPLDALILRCVDCGTFVCESNAWALRDAVGGSWQSAPLGAVMPEDEAILWRATLREPVRFGSLGAELVEASFTATAIGVKAEYAFLLEEANVTEPEYGESLGYLRSDLLCAKWDNEAEDTDGQAWPPILPPNVRHEGKKVYVTETLQAVFAEAPAQLGLGLHTEKYSDNTAELQQSERHTVELIPEK